MTSIISVLFRPAPVMAMTINKSVYTPEWVERLFRGCRRGMNAPFRFVCITDYPKDAFSRDIDVVPFKHKCHAGRWMCLNEVLRPDLELGNAIMMGLDTVVTGDITPFAEHWLKFSMLRPPGGRSGAWNGITLFRDAGWLWERYEANMAQADSESRYERWARHQGSEMLYWLKNVDYTFIQDDIPEVNIKSYKHERDQCRDADIVYWQGAYKPDTSPEGWVRDSWV